MVTGRVTVSACLVSCNDGIESRCHCARNDNEVIRGNGLWIYLVPSDKEESGKSAETKRLPRHCEVRSNPEKRITH
jgi:hypothetical protein